MNEIVDLTNAQCSIQLLPHIVCYALGYDNVDTMHLLLGLLQGSNGVVTQLIQNQGADVNRIREQASHNSP
jgi:ATP-dependent Clp protease ATP-binding subunit ClpA